MKCSRKMVLSLLVLSLTLSLTPSAFADKGHEDPAFLKLLSDSAAALQAVHSPLAAGMAAFSKDEADEAKGIKGPVRTEAEKKVHRQAHLRLLRQSAETLRVSNPELAGALMKQVAEKEKRMAEKKK